VVVVLVGSAVVVVEQSLSTHSKYVGYEHTAAGDKSIVQSDPDTSKSVASTGAVTSL
jgi:hypothetical protein